MTWVSCEEEEGKSCGTIREGWVDDTQRGEGRPTGELSVNGAKIASLQVSQDGGEKSGKLVSSDFHEGWREEERSLAD